MKQIKMNVDINKLKKAEEIANKHFDGHLTIMSFTTEVKAMFYTPNLDTGFGRYQLFRTRGFNTLNEALDHIIHKYGATPDLLETEYDMLYKQWLKDKDNVEELFKPKTKV